MENYMISMSHNKIDKQSFMNTNIMQKLALL